MSRLVDADALVARLQERADSYWNAANLEPRGSTARTALNNRSRGLEIAIEVVKDAPIHPEPSHGVGPHASGVGVAVSESEPGVLPSPGLGSDTASSPAAPPPSGLEGVGAPASPDPTPSDFLELQEEISGALLKAHRLAVWRDEALPLLAQWLDLAHAASDAGLISVPYGQSTTAALARWIRQHIEQQQGGQS